MYCAEARPWSTQTETLDTLIKLYISMPESRCHSKEVLIVSLNFCLAKLCSVCTSHLHISCKGLLDFDTVAFSLEVLGSSQTPVFFEKLFWTRAS